MRKTFSQVLSQANIDFEEEYYRLYDLFHGLDNYGRAIRKIINENFTCLNLRRTCLTLDDFDETCGFEFGRSYDCANEELLVSFCEYCFNLIVQLQPWAPRIPSYPTSRIDLLKQQILRVIESIGYMPFSQNEYIDFVPNSVSAIAASEILPAPLSYKVIYYNHHSMKGNLDAKRTTLLQLANLMEGKKKDLKRINSCLHDHLFFLFNNINIRHNNTDPSNESTYKDYVTKMSSSDLEHWYDETYQMCLLAFLELDNENRKEDVKKLKEQMQESR